MSEMTYTIMVHLALQSSPILRKNQKCMWECALQCGESIFPPIPEQTDGHVVMGIWIFFFFWNLGDFFLFTHEKKNCLSRVCLSLVEKTHSQPFLVTGFRRVRRSGDSVCVDFLDSQPQIPKSQHKRSRKKKRAQKKTKTHKPKNTHSCTQNSQNKKKQKKDSNTQLATTTHKTQHNTTKHNKTKHNKIK